MRFYFTRVKYGKIWSRAVTVETCNVLSREVKVWFGRV